MSYKSTLKELYSKKMFPYKVWYILLEDIDYKANEIFDIAHNAAIEPFYSENLRRLWDMGENQIEKRMMYNMSFLDKLEAFLIKNGIYFNWIMRNNEYIGIRIQPSLVDFNGILKDCMTFEEFSWNRFYMNVENKSGR